MQEITCTALTRFADYAKICEQNSYNVRLQIAIFLLSLFRNPSSLDNFRNKFDLTAHFMIDNPVRVKGGLSLRNCMRHGVWNGINMRNTIYTE